MILGISGKARSGKGCVGSYIQLFAGLQQKPLICRQLAFADALKAEAQVIGWDGAKDLPGRFLLQQMGCARRDIDPMYWIRQLEAQISRSVDLYVLTDVRFLNEACWIKEQGGEVWRVVKHGGVQLGDTAAAHVSETELDDWLPDVVLEAKAGDLAGLYTRTMGAFHDFCERNVVRGSSG